MKRKIIFLSTLLVLLVALLTIFSINSMASSSTIIFDGSSIAPVLGETPKLLTIEENENYEIYEQTWSNGQGATVFEEGVGYTYEIILSPKGTYQFDSDAVLRVENVDWELEYGEIINDDSGRLRFIAEFTFPQTIEISGIKEPKVGEVPILSTEGLVPETANYEVTDIFWFESTSGTFESYEDFTVMDSNMKFREGYYYFLGIHIKSKEKWEFPREVDITVAGRNIIAESSFIGNAWQMIINPVIEFGQLEGEEPEQDENIDSNKNENQENQVKQDNKDNTKELNNPPTGDNIITYFTTFAIAIIGICIISIKMKNKED